MLKDFKNHSLQSYATIWKLSANFAPETLLNLILYLPVDSWTLVTNQKRISSGPIIGLQCVIRVRAWFDWTKTTTSSLRQEPRRPLLNIDHHQKTPIIVCLQENAPRIRATIQPIHIMPKTQAIAQWGKLPPVIHQFLTLLNVPNQKCPSILHAFDFKYCHKMLDLTVFKVLTFRMTRNWAVWRTPSRRPARIPLRKSQRILLTRMKMTFVSHSWMTS